MGTVKNSFTNAPIATYKWLANGTKAGAVNGNGTFGMEYLGSLVYRRNAAGDLTLESTAFGEGRILAAETGTGYDYTSNYFITDHLGSTRAVVELTAGGTARVNERSDFHPFGARHINPAAVITDNRYRFSGKEDQESIGLHFQDFGARMYDAPLGRWWSVDPLQQYHSGYVYCGNNPINKIDSDGRWDIRVHVYSDRAAHGYGIAIVADRRGNEVQRFNVRAEGVGGRDRNVTGADTPLGVYDIPAGDTWRASTNDNRISYGPNDRLVMNPESLQILETGRDGIRMHGGRQETYDAKTDTWSAVADPSLKKTQGCLRVFDADMENLIEITSNLQESDSAESPGSVTVIDDLQKVVSPANNANMIEVTTTYELPQTSFPRYNR